MSMSGEQAGRLTCGGGQVWDYLGDNYVHRLVANKVDGKLVELPEGGRKSGDKGEEVRC